MVAKMAEELIKEVKMRLRSLVVSSPTQMDSRLVMRDYSKLLGTHIPLSRMGYRDFVTFLRERCSDSFLLSGPPSNPILTVIVPESSKHIDKFVQRSKLPSTAKVKTKRRSIQETKVDPPEQCLIYNSFVKHKSAVIEEPKVVEVKALDIIPKSTSQNKENFDHHKNTTVTSNDVKNFFKKRFPLYNSLHHLDEAVSEKDGAQSLFQDDDSGRHTSSSGSSTKTRQFEELKTEIMELITAAPEGVWCTDLIRLYRERYNRELNFTRFGYTSIVSLAYALEASVQITRPVDTGDWLLTERRRAAPAPAALRVRTGRAGPPHARAPAPEPDPDDALPGIQFDPDVFPADCVRFMESIPALSLADCRPGAMLEVMVGEVYSPSHFWLIRLGERYNLAMEEIMDEMTLYYNGEGRERALARGAVRVGHYCSTLFENDWHRSVIVKIVDSDTVKVRHVDYGTVETVPVSGLRPLRRAWAALPAQAARARLAGLRPSAQGRRWPHAAAAHFLRLVQDKRLYANVVAVDPEHDVLETLLIDTRGAEDVCVSSELIRAGHADARADSALRTAECYLYPRFEALESGDTPNMAEIHAYLRDGIALDYVDAYRRHVPLCLPAPARPEVQPGPEHCLVSPPASSSLEDTLHELYVASPPSPESGEDTLYEDVASPPRPEPGEDTLHELGPSPPAPLSPEPSEVATRIPLLWPGAGSAAPCPTREDPLSVPSASPAPPPTHTLAAPIVEQISVPPPRDLRQPAVRVDPSVNLRSAINPEAQSFTPRQRYHLQPVAYPLAAPPPLTPRPPAGLPGCGPFPPQGQPAGWADCGPFPPQGQPAGRAGCGPFPPSGQPAGRAGCGPFPPSGQPAGMAGCGPFLPPGPQYGVPGMVTLSMAECDTYRQLSRVNPHAAHWYMVGTLARAMGTPADMGPWPAMGPMRPPPGFGA